MPQRKYIDFKLYLTATPGGQGGWQVALLPTPEVGETLTPANVPADRAPDADLLVYLARKQISLGKLIELGKQLADCLLPEGTIRERFRTAYERAGDDGGVRLRLIIADHALKQWPWEYVYLDLLGGPDSLRGFLGLSKRISIVRHEPLPRPHPTLPAADLAQLPMLITAALPAGQRELNLAKEVANVEEAVRGFDVAGVRIAPKSLIDPIPGELREALSGPGSAYIFHFAGHGLTALDAGEDDDLTEDEGYILLVEDRVHRREAYVSANELATYLDGAGVRLAVLGACQSGARSATYPWDGVASALIARDVPAVIAMQYEVLDPQAIAFSRALYTGLGLGLSLDEAVWSGRAAMLEGTGFALDAAVSVEWGVPVLYSRLPDGALFPQQMKRTELAGAAEVFRRVISQTVDGIQQGTMTGVRVNLIQNGVKVVQKIKEAQGRITGVEATTVSAGANIVVEQEFESTGQDSQVTGLILDEL